MSEFFQNLWDGKRYVSTDGEFTLMLDDTLDGRTLAIKPRISVATHVYVKNELTWSILAMKEWVLVEQGGKDD